MSIITLKKWGNSMGFCIPANELKSTNAYIGEQFELSINTQGGFLLMPVSNPQAGWTEAFNAIADTEPASSLIEHIETDFDREEWAWE